MFFVVGLLRCCACCYLVNYQGPFQAELLTGCGYEDILVFRLVEFVPISTSLIASVVLDLQKKKEHKYMAI